MDMRLNQQRGEITMFFEPSELDRDAAFLLGLVYHEERERGTIVPSFETDLLKQFETMENPVEITLGSKYFEFIIIFLWVMYQELEDSEMDTSVLENFIFEVNMWFFGKMEWDLAPHTIH